MEKERKIKMNEAKLESWGLTAHQIKNRNNEDHYNKFENKERQQRELGVE